jgi:ABC-2 type transport system permease protein
MTREDGAARGPGLRRELKLWEAVALSIGIMAPTAAMALNGTAPAGLIGRAVPLAFVFATLAAGTGRRPVASGGAAAFAVLGFLINGFAPLVDAIEWLKYVSPFYYYEGHDPIANGVNLGDLAVLLAAAAVLTVVAVVGFGRRDLRN